MSRALLGLAALAATTYAHGTVSGITADGVYSETFQLQFFYEYANGGEPDQTPGWYAENLDNGFVAPDAYQSADIICHKNAIHANSSATVAAGGTVDFHWTAWPESHMGPVITYVANCGDDCATVSKEELQWVKIDAGGYDNGEWAALKMIANNNTWSTPVPDTLAAGKYVFRNEIIALHGAGSENGAQNYPQCVNIEITGSGSDNPEGTVGTKLYTKDEAGILFNPYAATIDYTIPGPALYGSGSGSGSGSGNSSAPAPSATPTATAPAAGSSGAASATPTIADAVQSPSAAPTSGAGAEKTYTLESFIAFLEEQAGAASKVRRHAREFF